LAFVCFMHLCVHQGDLCSYSLSSFPSLFLADFFCSFKTQFHISCSRSVPGAFLSGSNALYCDFFFLALARTTYHNVLGFYTFSVCRLEIEFRDWCMLSLCSPTELLQ
jgi:hypothetical protein